VLLNTSFNVRGEPIVCSPADALRCFIKADLDVLVLEDFIVEKQMISEELRDAVQLWYGNVSRVASETNVYSFV
jgi:carbamoyltransferase